MTYTIEKNVPLPSPQRAGRPAKYPWREMRVGDSFVIDKPTQQAATRGREAGRSLGMKFSCRKIDANHTRIWRVA